MFCCLHVLQNSQKNNYNYQIDLMNYIPPQSKSQRLSNVFYQFRGKIKSFGFIFRNISVIQLPLPQFSFISEYNNLINLFLSQ